MWGYIVAGVMGCVLFIGGLMWGLPQYSVWQQGLSGQAALARATQDRQIKIQEADADKEAAKLNAEAEVFRAQGAAKANKILIDNLGSAENYLRWRYIMMLENSHQNVSREVIYTPADGSFPITEAGRALPRR